MPANSATPRSWPECSRNCGSSSSVCVIRRREASRALNFNRQLWLAAYGHEQYAVLKCTPRLRAAQPLGQFPPLSAVNNDQIHLVSAQDFPPIAPPFQGSLSFGPVERVDGFWAGVQHHRLGVVAIQNPGQEVT